MQQMRVEMVKVTEKGFSCGLNFVFDLETCLVQFDLEICIELSMARSQRLYPSPVSSARMAGMWNLQIPRAVLPRAS